MVNKVRPNRPKQDLYKKLYECYKQGENLNLMQDQTCFENLQLWKSNTIKKRCFLNRKIDFLTLKILKLGKY